MPEHCFVAEDAPAGIQAARAGRMAALGVARLHDEVGLTRSKVGGFARRRRDRATDIGAGAGADRRPGLDT